jgi:hypothetical protein
MSVEHVREVAQSAAKSNLFERRKTVKIFEQEYVIRRLTRKEMFESGLSYLSSYLMSLGRELERESDLEKKKKIIEESEKTQYEFEKKLLLMSVEDLSEEKLDEMDINIWRELLNAVVEFNFLTRAGLSARRESREGLIPATL